MDYLVTEKEQRLGRLRDELLLHLRQAPQVSPQGDCASQCGELCGGAQQQPLCQVRHGGHQACDRVAPQHPSAGTLTGRLLTLRAPAWPRAVVHRH